MEYLLLEKLRFLIHRKSEISLRKVIISWKFSFSGYTDSSRLGLSEYSSDSLIYVWRIHWNLRFVFSPKISRHTITNQQKRHIPGGKTISRNPFGLFTYFRSSIVTSVTEQNRSVALEKVPSLVKDFTNHLFMCRQF